MNDPNFYRDILFHIHDGVYFVNRDRTILYWNGGASRLTGYSPDEVIGRHCNDNILNHVDERGCDLCENGCPLSAAVADGEVHEAKVFLRHKLGHRVPVSIRVQPFRGKEGNIEGAIEIFNDNTAEVDNARKSEELRRLAFLDHLTQLPNRRFLEMALQTAFTEYQVHKSPFAVMVVDVDNFKAINDSRGHACGDRLLHVIGQTLVESLRASDIVGRWGGDEFLAIVRNVDQNMLLHLADRCVSIVARSEAGANQNDRCSTTISIGATLVRATEDISALVHRADRLNYASKTAGRNRATID